MPESEVPKFDIYTKEKITRAEEAKRLDAAIKSHSVPTYKSNDEWCHRSRRNEPKPQATGVPPEWSGYKVARDVKRAHCRNTSCDEPGMVAMMENGKCICLACSWDQELDEIDFTHMEMIANQ